ncbi:hypothetical protein ACHZ98_29120 [Streptomyces sp. MAR4 CNY-716]
MHPASLDFIDEGERSMGTATRPTVIHRTREQLLEQRKGLLQEIHMSHEELRDRAETYSLSMEELDVWYTIQGIDYLLKGDR